MPPVRRINLFCGPGHGKTTTYYHLMATLKAAGEPAEGVHEVAKLPVGELKLMGGSAISQQTQWQIFAEQYHQETVRLQAWPVCYVVNESNPLISLFHAQYFGQRWILDDMWRLQHQLDASYSSLNIFLEPPADQPYQQQGRYQDAGTTSAMHRAQRAFVAEYYQQADRALHSPLIVVGSRDHTTMLAHIRQARG